jgi:hypothetical protein
MSAFELVRPTDSARSRAVSLTRTLYVPDLEGNWRELRLGSRSDVAGPAAPAPRLRRGEFFLMPRAA